MNGLNEDGDKLKEKHPEFEESVSAKQSELNDYWNRLDTRVCHEMFFEELILV